MRRIRGCRVKVVGRMEGGFFVCGFRFGILIFLTVFERYVFVFVVFVFEEFSLVIFC